MAGHQGVLFVSHKDILGLLGVEDAMRVCEEVYLMHARGSVVLSNPPSFKLDVADGFNNHWHVNSVFLKDVPATGVRLYKKMVEAGLFSREKLHCEIQELVAGTKTGRERDDERILIHTTGLLSQDVALAHFLYERAAAQGLGIVLPKAE
jgi:ornithine cyclodeaminase/alanine dehydrogenase-like protein (mu-crystallin family)